MLPPHAPLPATRCAYTTPFCTTTALLRCALPHLRHRTPRTATATHTARALRTLPAPHCCALAHAATRTCAHLPAAHLHACFRTPLLWFVLPFALHSLLPAATRATRTPAPSFCPSPLPASHTRYLHLHTLHFVLCALHTHHTFPTAPATSLTPTYLTPPPHTPHTTPHTLPRCGHVAGNRHASPYQLAPLPAALPASLPHYTPSPPSTMAGDGMNANTRLIPCSGRFRWRCSAGMAHAGRQR